MSLLNRISLSYPVALVTVCIVLSVLLSQIGAVLLEGLSSHMARGDWAIVTRYLVSVLIFALLWKMGALRTAGLTMPLAQWGRKWSLTLLLMMPMVFINLANVHWQALHLEAIPVFIWFADNLATGLFEEIMMRGLAFYLLYRAWSWQAQTKGQSRAHILLKASLTQAFIFGALHLLNLLNGVSIAVFAQVIYATLLGIGFAGMVAWCRSLWPAIFCHAAINAAGSLNRYFVPDYVQVPLENSIYGVLIVIIFLVTAVPGIWLMNKRAQQAAEASASDEQVK